MTLDEATILIVDDEPQLLAIFSGWFEREGCRVLLARNGAEGLELAMSNRINLVISDIRMPVMNGIEMAERISKQPDYVPQMLFVSGFGDVDDRDLYDIGVARKLNKPIRRHELVEAARHCLLEKEERWSKPLEPNEETLSEVAGPVSGTKGRDDRIAFGRGGFCLHAKANLQEGRLVRLTLTDELDTPASVVAAVRWIEPKLLLSGLEIRHVDDTGRSSVIRATDNVSGNAFIPRTVGSNNQNG